MSCDAAIRSYCQEVRQRRELLVALRQELKDRFLSEPALTLEEICQEVGPPEETTATLMEGVEPEALARYRARRGRKIRGLVIVLAAVAVLAVCLVVHMWRNGGLVVIETTHYEEGLPEDFPMGGEDSWVERYYYHDGEGTE